MPKARATCTRCSQRRQRCDRETPCSRCVKNNEAHLCTTEWRHGYDPNIHRRYPRKSSPPGTAPPVVDTAQLGVEPWPTTTVAGSDIPTRFRSQSSANATPQTSPSVGSRRSQETVLPTNSLDFVTFGRSDYADISIGKFLSSRDSYVRDKTLMDQSLSQCHGTNKQLEAETINSGFSPAARAVEVYHLRSLLPDKERLMQMIDYHEKYMLYWSGGVYHGPSFRKSVQDAYGVTNEMNLQNLDWRWLALLFSVLSSSLIGSPDAISTSWGYTNADKLRITKQWGNATIACLQLGDFASKYHIYSIQAILNMHCSEHLVGSSKEWAVYQSGAIVIARGLNLHRLGPQSEDNLSELTAEQREARIQRETGRRVWWALAAQDWLCSTSQGTYSIQKRHFNTIAPGYFNEETMIRVKDGTPTHSHVANHLFDVASLLVDYQDDMIDAPDQDARYNIVLRYDARMRSLAADKMPYCLSPQTPFNPAWPKWVRWARRLHIASSAHKITMIHQAFLSRSFKSPQYAYTRWACATAAKTVIEEMGRVRDPEEPQWWVEQAFVVTAGICLALDVFHRSEKDPEVLEYLSWIDKSIKALESWPNSSVATHGIRLLSSLVQEYQKKSEALKPQPAQPAANTTTLPPFLENITAASITPASTEIAQLPTPSSDGVLATEGYWMPNVDVDMLGFEDLMETLPHEASLDNTMFFESMLSLANSQFF